MHVLGFFVFFPILPLLTSGFAVFLWKRTRPLFPDARTANSPGYFANLYRYLGAIPSIAAAFSFKHFPALLVSHYSSVEVNKSLKVVFEILQWPLWVACIGPFVCALSISVTGRPRRLVPPVLRL